MNINPIKGVSMPVFGARLACNHGAMRNYINYSCNNESKALIEKIAEAFSKHPSNAIVKPSIQVKQGLYGTRGAIKSRYATYVDVEPTENDGAAALKNILRRILDPENKECFNNIMGRKHCDYYGTWWKENIAPIWEEINSKFRCKKFFGDNYDKDFNQDFRERREKTWYSLINKK